MACDLRMERHSQHLLACAAIFVTEKAIQIDAEDSQCLNLETEESLCFSLSGCIKLRLSTT